MRKIYLLLIALFIVSLINNYCLSGDVFFYINENKESVVFRNNPPATPTTPTTNWNENWWTSDEDGFVDGVKDCGDNCWSDKDGEWKWSQGEETTVKNYGITLWWDCLNGVWKNCFRYEEIVWIDKSGKEHTALSIVQDVIYAATYMVWTVLTIVIIWCGLWYIIAARWWKDTNAYRKWLINGAIWAILVLTAYTIVRLIQYIAKW